MRNSSIELLRILCIVAIVIMHVLGGYWNTDSVALSGGILAINSVANCAVTIFVLISGYYGINFSVKKLLGLTNIVWLYTWIAFFVLFICEAVSLNFKEISGFLFPIVTSKYWFISVYCFIFCLAPYLNRIKDLLSQKRFLTLLGVLLLFFYVAPTVTLNEILHDGGKGIVNLTTIYLIGQYLSKYGFPKFFNKRVLVKILGFIGIIFLLNAIFTAAVGHIYQPFARDNNVLILVLSILIFRYAVAREFTSVRINRLARYVFPIYILNGYALRLVPHVNLSPILTLLCCIGIALGICVAVIGVEKLRRLMFAGICERVANAGNELFNKYMG